MCIRDRFGASLEIFYENDEYRATWSPTTDVDSRLDDAEADIDAIEINVDEIEADIDDLQYPTVEAQTGSFSVSPSNPNTPNTPLISRDCPLALVNVNASALSLNSINLCTS